MSDIILIRVNCPSREEAKHLATLAVEAQLAACANIEGPILSVYHWEGRIEHDEEYVLWLKSRSSYWTETEKLIADNHSFDTPAILSFACKDANARYEAWLHSSIRPD